jgi:hypothetical protein
MCEENVCTLGVASNSRGFVICVVYCAVENVMLMESRKMRRGACSMRDGIALGFWSVKM